MFRWDAPIDVKGVVEDGDAAIGLGVIEVITLLYHTPKGVYWRSQVFRLMHQGFLFCFCLIQIDLSDAMQRGYDKNLDKHRFSNQKPWYLVKL